MLDNTQKRNFISQCCAFGIMLFCSIFSSVSFAAFDVIEGEEEEGYYGNAKTREFKESIEGAEYLNPRDRAFLNSVFVTRITNRWYLRALVGHPKIKVSNLTNESGGALGTIPLANTTLQDNLYQLLLAGGKVWQNWGFEGEILLSKKFNYAFNPQVPTAAQVSGNLKFFALFFNLQYIIPRWFDWYPRHLQVHLDAGTGGAIKVSDTTSQDAMGNPIDSSSARIITFTGQLGVGARYQLATHWLVDFDYRYFDLGKSKYGPVQGVQIQSNKLQTIGYFFGVTYQV